MSHLREPEDRFWNPYMAGIMLGLVLLSSFLVMGKGLVRFGSSQPLGHRGSECRGSRQGGRELLYGGHHGQRPQRAGQLLRL